MGNMWFNPKLPDAAPRRTKWALTHPLAGRPKPVLGRPAAGGRIRLSSQLVYFFLLPLCLRRPALSMERASVSLKHAQWVECCPASAMVHKRSVAALQRFMCCSCRHEADCRL